MTDASLHEYGNQKLLGGRPHEGPASKRITTGYGFWIFLLSDIVMFSCFFLLRGLCGAARADRGRPERRGVVRSQERCSGKRLSSCCRVSPAGSR